jgi:hypothetical protein
VCVRGRSNVISHLEVVRSDRNHSYKSDKFLKSSKYLSMFGSDRNISEWWSDRNDSGCGSDRNASEWE